MDNRVIVIGTTPDYVSYIAGRYPGQALFVSDRSVAASPLPAGETAWPQIVCDLSQVSMAVRLIRSHCREHRIRPVGITCFDCEWLVTTARIATQMKLPYSSEEAICLCRDKSKTRRAWSAAGVDCPQAEIIGSVQEAATFVDRTGGPVVFKPLLGSGSELTFVANNRLEAASVYRHMETGLKARAGLPMFRVNGCSDPTAGDHMPILAEQFAAGREYSCDVLIDGDQVKIIRVARKIMRPGFPFGVTLAYVVPGRLPGWLSEKRLQELVGNAARALKLRRALCMVDFIVRRDRVLFLELTPRPGGDCLPALIRHSSGLDMLKLALDFARKQPTRIPVNDEWRRMVGLRLFADRGGKLRHLDGSRLASDTRIKEVSLIRKPGDIISLPPDDYSTWLLGSVVFEPEGTDPVETDCDDICSKMTIDIEPYYEEIFPVNTRSAGKNGQAAHSAN